MTRRAAECREEGFTIIEVIVAAILITVCVSGIASVAAMTNVASAKRTALDQQASILHSVSEKLRTDGSWAKRGTTNGSTTSDETCATMASHPTVDISTSWFTARAASELDTSRFNSEHWKLSAVAQKIDSQADGTCGAGAIYDRDGVLPDYYRVTLVVEPTGSTLDRFPGMLPSIATFDANIANRAAGGRLVIQACMVTPQIDERIPVGQCENANSDRKLVALPAGSWITGTSLYCGQSALDVDCDAFRCAADLLDDSSCPHPWLAGMADPRFTKVQTEPHAGAVAQVRGDPTNPQISSVNRSVTLDADGRAVVLGLLPGRYRVTIPPPAGFVAWGSHSVPADGWATATAGAETHAVQMYKPAKRRTITVKVETDETNGPWWDGYPIHYEHHRGGARTLVLAPIPRGRSADVGATFNLPSGDNTGPWTTYARFTNVEPGLYAGYLTDTSFNAEHTLRQENGRAIGYFFVPPNGPIALPVNPNRYINDPATGNRTDFEWHHGWCDPDNVDGSPYTVGVTYYHPRTFYKWVDADGDGTFEWVVDYVDPQYYSWTATPCNSGGGGGAPPGTGGGGGG